MATAASRGRGTISRILRVEMQGMRAIIIDGPRVDGLVVGNTIIRVMRVMMERRKRATI